MAMFPSELLFPKGFQVIILGWHAFQLATFWLVKRDHLVIPFTITIRIRLLTILNSSIIWKTIILAKLDTLGSGQICTFVKNLIDLGN